MPEERLANVGDFLARFTRTTQLTLGWHGVARKGDDVIECRVLVPARVTGSIKGVYARVRTPDELLSLSDALANACSGVRPGVLSPVSSISRAERVRWRSVEYVAPDLYCPACQRRAFEWEDGDGSTYGTEGKCSACGAEVRFRNSSVGA
jgi:hypothetical protein